MQPSSRINNIVTNAEFDETNISKHKLSLLDAVLYTGYNDTTFVAIPAISMTQGNVVHYHHHIIRIIPNTYKVLEQLGSHLPVHV